jgi:uncharacterized lipoprotein YddW (UPF0748 family)
VYVFEDQKLVKRHTAYLLLVIFLMTPVPLRSSGDSFLADFLDSTPIVPKKEIRAVWVVRDALTSKDRIDRMIDFAVRARFHLVFAQVRGRADAFYRSSLEPEAAALEKPVDAFDPLAYLLRRAHEAGIAVHAWVNVFYVWSDRNGVPPPDHVVSRHPDWLAASEQGVRMDSLPVERWQGEGIAGYFVSPGHPGVRSHTVSVIKEIVSNYPVDGIHLDYIRYPNSRFDYSTTDRTEFALRYGVDPLRLSREGERLYHGISKGEVQLLDSLRTEWRIAQVDSMVRAVRRAIGEVPLSAAVITDPGRAKREKGQDWVKWLIDRDVDFVALMAYGYEPGDLVRRIRVIRNAVGADRFLVGLPLFDGRSRYLGYSVSLLRNEGILGYALFSYNVLQEQEFPLSFLERVFLSQP